MNPDQFILSVIQRAFDLFLPEPGPYPSYAKHESDGWKISSNRSPGHQSGELERLECRFHFGDVSPNHRKKTQYRGISVGSYPSINESSISVTSISGGKTRKGSCLNFKFRQGLLTVSVYSVSDSYRVQGTAGVRVPVRGISQEITEEQIQFVKRVLPNFLIVR